MSTQSRPVPQAAATSIEKPNGAGAAAILSAGIGCALVAFFANLADKSAFFHNLFIFSQPTGPLSGVTTSAIVAWLILWAVLHARWHNRTVALRPINMIAIVCLILSLLFTFPPIADLL